MSTTKVSYTGDGVSVLFTLTFPYLQRAHVKATINGASTSAFTFANDNIIQFDSAPANGDDIVLFRETSADEIDNTFFPNSSIRSAALNDNFLQALYVAEEARNAALDAQLGDILPGSIGTVALVDGSVTEEKVAPDAITDEKVAAGAGINPTKIAGTAVITTDPRLSNERVPTDQSVTTAKLDPAGLDPVLTSINNGPLAGFRNAVINGNFDFWQRATSNSTHLSYSADRWGNNFVGSSGTSARQAFTLGQTDVPGEPTFFMRTTVSSVTGADNRVNLFQRIEGVRTFAGQEVTVSFWAKANAAKNISVEFLQQFGTGGSPSAIVRGIGVTKTEIGTSWQRVTVTTTLPSIAGKTIGTNEDDYLLLTIWFDAGTNYDAYTDSLGHQSGVFDISRVQLEPGPVATVLERRPLGVELALCQRYFIGYPTGTAASDLNELLGIGSSYPVQSGVPSTRYKLGGVTWPTTMRATPIITWLPTEVYSNCTDFVVAASKFGCRSSALSVSTGPMYVTLSTGSISIDAEL